MDAVPCAARGPVIVKRNKYCFRCDRHGFFSARKAREIAAEPNIFVQRGFSFLFFFQKVGAGFCGTTADA